MNRLLITICGRAGSKGFKNKNLKVFCGKPLVYYSLSAAELFIKNHPELQVDVALNTDSEDLAKLVAAQYPEVVYLPRGAELGGDRVPKMAVYQDSLRRMEERTGQPYDWHMDLDITSPSMRRFTCSSVTFWPAIPTACSGAAKSASAS